MIWIERWWPQPKPRRFSVPTIMRAYYPGLKHWYDSVWDDYARDNDQHILWLLIQEVDGE